jgi:uncharacterized protein YraI
MTCRAESTARGPALPRPEESGRSSMKDVREYSAGIEGRKSSSMRYKSALVLALGAAIVAACSAVPPATTSPTHPPTASLVTMTPPPRRHSGCVTAASLRLRAGPNASSPVLGGLAFGTCVPIFGADGTREWAFVASPDGPGWVSIQYLQVSGSVSDLPVVGEAPGQQAHPPAAVGDKSPDQVAKETGLRHFLQDVVNDPRYDRSNQVMHKFLDFTTIDLTGDQLTYTVLVNVGTADAFAELAAELILGGAIYAKKGTPQDWMLTRIEVYWPGPAGSHAAIYVSGQADIGAIARQEKSPLDLMVPDVSYGGGQP